MCELMGFNFVRPIQADFSIREFAQRGRDNADGWGLAWYPDESVAVIKEAVGWQTSHHTRFLESYHGIRSHICLAHVRHLTRGRPTHADTHPFTREFAGRDYCFAHNGTLPDAFALPLGRFRPLGQTDSEFFFCHLLEAIASWGGDLAAASLWPLLHAKAQECNRGGKLNFLLSDGRTLICYHDLGGWKGLTFKPMLVHDQERRTFDDRELHVEIGGEPVNLGVVVATSPLSVHGWEPFHTGELLVLQEGRIRHSSHRPAPQSGSTV